MTYILPGYVVQELFDIHVTISLSALRYALRTKTKVIAF